MLDSWIANVVGRMRVAGISNRQLAEESGYAYTYLSTVLHGQKGDQKTQIRILEALARLEQKTETADKEGSKKEV